MPFQKFGLPSSVLRNVQALNYTAPTPIQNEAIPLIRTGRDLVATAQTGTGKTAAFLLPVIQQLLERQRGGTGALVLTPTRELAQQIEGCFRALAKGTPLRGALVIGGVPEAPQQRSLQAGVDLVVATPGRLLALLRGSKNPMPALATLILDEADQMFDLGFFPDVKRIIAQLPAKRQTLLFSATMPPDVARLGQTILQNPHKVAVGTQGTPTATVNQNVYPVPAQRKTALLEHLIEQIDEPSILVFTRTKHGARRLARVLNESGHDVAELHSDRSPAQRTRAMQGFRSQACKVMVATNIAARGLDVRHITHVINFDVPAAPEEYVHRIGRAGRAGDTGEAIVFMSPEEAPILARIERQIGKRLPRLHLTDFDYTVKHAPARSAGAKPSGGRPSGGNSGGPWQRREPALAAGGQRRKPSRGQGR